MRLAVVDADLCVGCQSCMFACSRRQGFAGLGKSRVLVSSAGGMSRGFRVIVCRACPDPPCADACPSGAMKVRSKGGVKVDRDKCTACGQCAEACPLGAITLEEGSGMPQVCVYCGYCARYCPHGVLAWEKEN